jgi:hypothetical protein
VAYEAGHFWRVELCNLSSPLRRYITKSDQVKVLVRTNGRLSRNLHGVLVVRIKIEKTIGLADLRILAMTKLEFSL